MRSMQSNLFNEEIPVSEAEVNEWLDSIKNLSALPSRREAYRRQYSVDEKIRNAKRQKAKASK
jgi:uncharacterized membrane-anchored protein YjiN (DUF445 family)